MRDVAIIRVINALNARYQKVLSERELRQIARERQDRELLLMHGIGKKSLAHFRKQYGEYTEPALTLRPDDV